MECNFMKANEIDLFLLPQPLTVNSTPAPISHIYYTHTYTHTHTYTYTHTHTHTHTHTNVYTLTGHFIRYTLLVSGWTPFCRQSKCNFCIHRLLGCSHIPSCAFKSECENGTLALLQRFKGNYFSRAVPMMTMIYVCFREKNIFKLIAQ